MIIGQTGDNLDIFRDHTGNDRVLGCLPPTPKNRLMRSARQSLSAYRAAQGLPATIPRSQWQPIDRRSIWGKEFVNDQSSCSGCVGWSAAGGQMRMRDLRGMTYQRLSGAFIYAQINGGRDSGAVITDAMTALEQSGTCLESEFNYPQIYTRQIPATANQTAIRFKLSLGLTVSTFDEIGTGLQMAGIPQFPINVGRNFENFDANGVAGASAGGNHSVIAEGMIQVAGVWYLIMANSWSFAWGPFSNGRCLLSEKAIQLAAGDSDAYIHLAELQDPLDANPIPTITA